MLPRVLDDGWYEMLKGWYSHDFPGAGDDIWRVRLALKAYDKVLGFREYLRLWANYHFDEGQTIYRPP